MYISIHAPTRGATQPDHYRRRFYGYFNPRSHEGSDTIWAAAYPEGVISIHAPTRGATLLAVLVVMPCPFQSTLPRGERLYHHKQKSRSPTISIHAPTRGATIMSITTRSVCRFQSTLPRGERHNTSGKDTIVKNISIRAPAWGATLSST